MSDPHFQAQGTIAGLNPRTRLDAAIAHANAFHADADFAFMSGDLVGDDVNADYVAIAQYLAKATIPINPLMGNNDSRASFRAHLPLSSSVMPDFVQYTVETPDAVILCLDTHKIGSAAGQPCADRLSWLDQMLARYANRQVYIFMHHLPFDLGLPPQDAIKLDEGAVFLDLIGRHGNVCHLFMGHVHRSTSGVAAGVHFATIGALSFQAPAPEPAWDWGSFTPPKEPPHYAIIHPNDGKVVVQYIQFCDCALGVEGAERKRPRCDSGAFLLIR